MFLHLLSIIHYFYRRLTAQVQIRIITEHNHNAPAPLLHKRSRKKIPDSIEGVLYGETFLPSTGDTKMDGLGNKQSFAGGVNGFGQCVAILTSGGDAQGMNSAIRATVRMAIYAGAKAFAVKWGYQGLVDGDITEVQWEDVTGISHLGGTIFGSARCKDFREREGRLKSAYNLVTRGITNLVVIGGDGSLTGADCFRKEWGSLLEELVKQGKIEANLVEQFGYLNIVGMVGSIDNDFCGTDMTIGADSALHRIMETVDAITTTADSHQRAFILEVMGRNCGYLALIAGIGAGADYAFIPEYPATDGWESRMCDHLQHIRDNGRLSSIIIISEGAIDMHGQSITANQVKKICTEQLGFDTRVTVLGHVQRGGTPSAFDRLLATRFGAEAALSILEADRDAEPTVMCLQGQKIVKRPLDECIRMCNDIKKAYADRDIQRVIELRGRVFESSLNMHRKLKMVAPPKEIADGKKHDKYKLAIMNVGAPAAGMNSAVRAFVRSALYNGHSAAGINDGFEGLLKDQVRTMTWAEVEKWAGIGGSNLGVSRKLPKDHLEKVDEIFRKHSINAVLILGGFEAYHGALQLAEARDKYDGFKIPMIVIPATVSNNVPGTYFSLGADTTLNVIVESCDRLRQSASSSQDRVFIVETMGGKCGYLATMAGIAGAADAAYIFEEGVTINNLQSDVKHLMHKFQTSNIKRGLILRNEHCNEHYTTDFITNLYQEEAQGVFKTRSNILGHVQQGGPPSPFDRLCGTRQAVKAYHFLIDQIEANKNEHGVINAATKESACLLGHVKNKTAFSPLVDLKEHTDFKNRIPTEQWWLHIRPLLRVLARYKVMFFREQYEDDQD